MDTYSSVAESHGSTSMTQMSDFISLIKFNGVPILPPVVC